MHNPKIIGSPKVRYDLAAESADDFYGTYAEFMAVTNIQNIPDINIENCKKNCFQYMFSYCKLLTDVKITARNAKENSFRYMFEGCSNLQHIEFNTDVLNGTTAKYMLEKCSSLKTCDFKETLAENFNYSAIGIVPPSPSSEKTITINLKDKIIVLPE